MISWNTKTGRQRGFTLLEVLIAVVVVGVGLLSVSSLQTRLMRQSGESTARAEATALAQARIEELRNYTDSIESAAQFDTVFATTAGFGNSVTIAGDNASFTRTEAIDATGATKQLDVRVAWVDRAGVNQNVELSTELGWESPRAVGDLARPDATPTVRSPGGRAMLGEGLLPSGASTSPNGDGTSIYVDGPDQKLVVDGRIVLTLPDSCDTTGQCVEFVKINGRVYIDTATQSSLAAGTVQIFATDAGYCHRYYTDGSGASVIVTNDTTSVPATPNGDYEYFDYRCYVSGGWYGNIGVLLENGLRQNDKICQGDPVATDAWKQPVIAARRAYRGMLHKVDANTSSGKEEDADGDPIYYSIGIADETILPDPTANAWISGDSYTSGTRVVYENYVYEAKRDHSGNTTSPEADTTNWTVLGSKKTHDFVISSMSTDATDGSNCVTREVMVRTDSNVNGTLGDRFADMPTDFICLNPSYVDDFSSPYAIDEHCPYDPTQGTPTRHLISGTIDVTVESEEAKTSMELITVNTSDGVGNCSRGSFVGAGSEFSANYVCDVYEWGTGWTGYIQVDPNSNEILCADSGSDGTTDNRLHLAGISNDTTVGYFECVGGNITRVQGTVTTTNANKTLASAEISETGGWCAVSTDGLSYECVTGVYSTDSWSGSITFTTSGGYVCGDGIDPDTGVATLSGLEPGILQLDLGIVNATGHTCPN